MVHYCGDLMSQYPFKIPERLICRLPKPAADGLYYVDVKFRSRWDGILVINSGFECIGVFVRRKIVQCSLPFAPEHIEDFRHASIENWAWASLPSPWDPLLVSMVLIPIVIPIFLLLSFLVSKWFALLPLAIIWSCISQMYAISGFPLVRPFLTLAGIGEFLFCIFLLMTRQL